MSARGEGEKAGGAGAGDPPLGRGGDTPVPVPLPPARTPRGDLIVAGAALALAALLALWLIPSFVRSPVAPRPLAMAPWFLPAVTTGLIALSGSMLLARAWRTGVARDDGAGGGDARGLLVALGVLVLFPVLMPRLGALATGIVLTLVLLLLARVGPLRLALVGILLPLAIWALFARGIGIPLPVGRLA